ncbi:pentapeptide repeat-containing protein [Aquimarina algiphila]|uniref:Pentapeptide repeat-containing protein n=1 Tax=Aquimarina algiphila TaxID=2047982 RepID=A0A554VBI9_9FLAO|nr:pentapeptide repeat-containing protein [Aquimarina algiphila]TSE03926.1 hypothetical protein FOF46_28085 [Aquimarina algiphila]
MNTKEEQDNKELRAENKRLNAKIQALEKSNRIKKNSVFWVVKKVFGVFIGVDLKKSIKHGFDEYHETKNISSETLSNISSHLIWRLTRIGFFGAFVTLIPSILLGLQTFFLTIQNDKIDNQNILISNQNKLIKYQNKRLDQEIYLQEAGRRSSLVFLFANVMDAIDQELKNSDIKKDRNLSEQLIGRIVSLSKSLKPYRYLSNDSLTPLISPERSHLFVNLINSNLGDYTYIKIFNKGNFKYLELNDIKIENIPFERVDFSHSIFKKVVFKGGNLNTLILDQCYLNSVEFLNINDLRDVWLRNSYIERLRFSNINLEDLSIKNSFVDNLFMHNTYSFEIELENCIVGKMTFADSFSVGLNVNWEQTESSAPFDPNNFKRLDSSKDQQGDYTNSANDNCLVFSNSFFVEVAIDKSTLPMIKNPYNFNFHRYLLWELPKKEEESTYFEIYKPHLLRKVSTYNHEKVYVLKDTLMTPNRILEKMKNELFIRKNSNRSYSYLEEYEYIVNQAKKILDFEHLLDENDEYDYKKVDTLDQSTQPYNKHNGS